MKSKVLLAAALVAVLVGSTGCTPAKVTPQDKPTASSQTTDTQPGAWAEVPGQTSDTTIQSNSSGLTTKMQSSSKTQAKKTNSTAQGATKVTTTTSSASAAKIGAVFEKNPGAASVPMTNLSNTAYKLTVEKRLKIGYIGGSVTEGVGASSKATCWAGLTTAWLRKQYPQAEITDVNAGYGGTGSGYALTRVARDLLSGNPDLVFIETSINDTYQQDTPLESAYYMEMLMQELYVKNPKVEIVIVFITDKGFNGGDNEVIKAQRALATHYGLHTIHVGAALRVEMDTTGKVWEDFSNDWVHPTDVGYVVYAKAVQNTLSTIIKDGKSLQTKKLPGLYMKHMVKKPQTIYADKIDLSQSNGWTLRNNGIYGQGRAHLACAASGAVLKIKFKGTGILLNVQQGANTCEKVTAVADGSYTRSFTTKVVGDERRTQTLFNNLPNGEHVLELKNESGGMLTMEGVTVLGN